jgi:hypothetical protein
VGAALVLQPVPVAVSSGTINYMPQLVARRTPKCARLQVTGLYTIDSLTTDMGARKCSKEMIAAHLQTCRDRRPLELQGGCKS